jgi:hypothetical protein
MEFVRKFKRPPILMAGNLEPSRLQQQIDKLLLLGTAKSGFEAENLFLDSHLVELAQLVANLSESEAASHEAVQLLLRHGSRPWEDALP